MRWPEDLEIIEEKISQKVDSEIFVLHQDLGGRPNDLREAIQSLMVLTEKNSTGAHPASQNSAD